MRRTRTFKSLKGSSGRVNLEGYVWNGWADDKTKFSNESMSGRTFAAMQKAAQQDPAVATRVRHYVQRCPEEFYEYDSDPDALNNLADKPEATLQIDDARSCVLSHLQRTNDPQLENYEAFLKSTKSEQTNSK